MNGYDLDNSLIRDGVSQTQRKLPLLSPQSVKIDDQDLADFLVYAYKLSKQITYYNSSNSDNSSNGKPYTWQEFFENSVPVQLAVISKIRPQQKLDTYNRQLKEFLADPSQTNLDEIFKTWEGMREDIENWSTILKPYTPFASIIKGLELTNLSNFYNNLSGLQQFDFSSQLIKQNSSNDLLSLNVLTDDEIRSQLDEVFQVLFQNYHQIIQEAPKYILKSLESRQDHSPHIALYIAFWAVLQPARDDLNRMTQKHLDFFYRNVLRFPEKPLQPDQAYLTFELAKSQKQEYLVKQGTQFKGGKDAQGTELIYQLKQDIVLHKAQIKSLKGLFLDSEEIGKELPINIKGLYASPVAKSADGQGADFPKEEPVPPIGNSPNGQGSELAEQATVKAWEPFGDATRPPAVFGLAIASPLLQLEEGTRNIIITLNLEEQFPQGASKKENKELDKLKSRSPNLFDLDDANDVKDKNDEREDQLSQLFQVRLSGLEDWLKIDKTNLSVIKSATDELRIEVTVPPEQPAILPYQDALKQPTFKTLKQPVLLLEINPEYRYIKTSKTDYLNAYHFLRFWHITQLKLTVTVDEVRNLIVQNEQGLLDATKPFEPFGNQPKIGSDFYIGSQEVFQKPLTKLGITFTLEKDKPEIMHPEKIRQKKIIIKFGTLAFLEETQSFGFCLLWILYVGEWYVYSWEKIYRTYGVKYDEIRKKDILNYKEFNPGQIKLEALRQKVWQHTDANININLFDKKTISLDDQLDNLKLKEKPSQPFEIDESLTPQTNNGFLRLQLIGDSFLHDQYTKVLTQQVLAEATSQIIIDRTALPKNVSPPKRQAVQGAYYKLSNGEVKAADTYYIEPNVKPLVTNEAYTPVITELFLNYTAEITYNPSTTTTQTQPEDIQLIHLYPFDGYQEITDSDVISLLPTIIEEGTLYIGIEDLNPSTALPLLIQVAEETADTELFNPSVQWSYLADNIWQPFKQYQIAQDGTNKLIHSGIVNLVIPAEINKKNTLFDPQFSWIKVTALQKTQAISNIIDIHTQAAQVSFYDQENDPNHLTKPLPANSISKLVEPQPALKKVEQPYDSFGGQGKETPNNYYLRVSEHLRHKGRAVTIFDYERLVLERYPQIYKVRCINHSRLNDSTDKKTEDNLDELCPGAVTLAVIPDLSQRTTTNDLQPKVNVNLLKEIETYLKQLSSDWVDIFVVNPNYQEIYVEFQVQFRPPADRNFDYYQRKLQRDIIRFLSPWTVSNSADIQFGGKIYRSSILKVVEELDYVDHVVNFQMHQKTQQNLKEISASSARSILTSVPFSDNPNTVFRHKIEEIKTKPTNQSLKPGLGESELEQLIVE